ncbi:hypothetical protein PACTADRAFT_4426 [Pachysolen tannophilus NRRL Y-2460]|uniref:Rhomboid-type serine protease 2 n=1 Tax=Pachysolen tannophilus NRRL Y-2460 TaxID=669874 RepID=A0A1E4TRT8_PACTA|nr:hypothetical protein PACTADRAFT_4426 [Pachysolen tannophilus NRRL Y-2460]
MVSPSNSNLSAINQYFNLAKTFLPVFDGYPPAFTSGFVVFLVLIYILSFFTSINDKIALNPWAPFNFDLNRISMYPLGHVSFFHLLFNIIAIVTPLSNFEKENGTVHTGIVLNILATVTALPYCLLGIIFYPNTEVLGASAWCFSFAAYEAHKQSLLKPSIIITPTFVIPTIYSPFVFLILIAVIAPHSSFMGHLFGILAGYALSFGYLTKLIEPPSKIVQFIEKKIDTLINLIPPQFRYYREIEVKVLRDEKLKTHVSISDSILPTHHTANNITADTNSRNVGSSDGQARRHTFSGAGHILGAS